MAEPYPHSISTGSPPSARARPAAEPARSDAGQGDDVAAEHPKGGTAPLPPGHPSRGTIDEGGDHRQGMGNGE